VDLPGYGYAKVAKELRNRWSHLVEPYIRQRKSLVGVIQLVDCRHEPTESDRQLAEWLDFYGVPTLVALTKTDKLSKSKALLAQEEVQRMLRREKSQCILFSAKTGQGKAELWKWIANRCRSF
jgi:GTP-binding protein